MPEPELKTQIEALFARVPNATKVLAYAEGLNSLPVMLGSCVLLRVEDEHFVLTAKHVLDQFFQQTESAGTLLIGSEPSYAPILFTAFSSMGWVVGEDRWPDIHDASVLAIDATSITDEMRRSALTPDFLELSLVVERQRVCVFGYPSSRYRNTERSTNRPRHSVWAGPVIPHSELIAAGYGPTTHLGVRFERESARKSDGSLDPGPGLPGVSGSGMWVLPRVGESMIGEHEGKLAAIFTAHVPVGKPRFLLGTSVRYFIEALVRGRPHLAGWFPGL